MRYKDETSLKLLGWDGKSSSFAFSLPWQRGKHQGSTDADGNGSGKRRKTEIEVTAHCFTDACALLTCNRIGSWDAQQIDLTVDEADEAEAAEDDGEVIETPAPKKPEPIPIVLE